MLRKGKEIALQAKESTNFLVNSLRAKYSSWSEGGSYPSDLPSGQPFRPSGQLVSGQVVSGQVVSGQVVGSNFGGFEAGGYGAKDWPSQTSNGWPSFVPWMLQEVHSQPRSPWDTAEVRRTQPLEHRSGRSPWS
ncbi:unnamed protein product [Durusdinium trenchii]|uniref:Uncharacterized protein n=2 Tax=Durusdinium trenchii TaxID=1381693 RepID=A0ABP0KA12_9DINO